MTFVENLIREAKMLEEYAAQQDASAAFHRKEATAADERAARERENAALYRQAAALMTAAGVL